MIDNLKDAIEHAREVAEYFTMKSNELYERQYEASLSCNECAKDNEQIADWLTELAERREADRWIPVSERLPETTNLILLSVKHETLTRTHRAVYGGYYDNKFLTVNSVEVEGCFVEGCNTKVEAWQPLPKPYESEAENE